MYNLYYRIREMNEKKVILFSPSSGENKVMKWTEVLTRFNLTSNELEVIINYNGIIEGFYMDEAL